MKFNDIITLFNSWGYVVNPSCMSDFKHYLDTMLSRNRVVLINDGDSIKAVMFFFITDDYNKVYKKPTWAVPEENPEGKQIYVDKFICQNFNLALRRQMQDMIEDFFPWCEELIYHRQPFDRMIRIRRRLCTKLVS